MCDVLLLIYEACTNINNYRSLRVCLAPGPVLNTSQTHLIPRKTLWVLLCPFYKLGACYPRRLISTLPQVMERQSWGPCPLCLTPVPVISITAPPLGPEQAGVCTGIHQLCHPP